MTGLAARLRACSRAATRASDVRRYISVWWEESSLYGGPVLVVPWVAVWESGQRLIFVVGLVRLIRFPEMVAKTLDADAFNTSTDDRCVKVPSRSLTDRGQCVPFEAHLHSFYGSAWLFLSPTLAIYCFA